MTTLKEMTGISEMDACEKCGCHLAIVEGYDMKTGDKLPPAPVYHVCLVEK